MVERLWNEWQQIRAESDALAEQQNASPGLAERHDAALTRLMTVEEALERRLKQCEDRMLVARVSLEIAHRRAKAIGEDHEPHWILVQCALDNIKALESLPK